MKHKDKLKGEKADKYKPEDFNKNQLNKGQKHEMEHTNNKSIAKEIAMDHLVEDSKYCTKLEKMESNSHLNHPQIRLK